MRAREAALIYTAHAIPTAMATGAPYTQQFAATAVAATQLLGRQDYRLAYQSQATGTPFPGCSPILMMQFSKYTLRAIVM